MRVHHGPLRSLNASEWSAALAGLCQQHKVPDFETECELLQVELRDVCLLSNGPNPLNPNCKAPSGKYLKLDWGVKGLYLTLTLHSLGQGSKFLNVGATKKVSPCSSYAQHPEPNC